jgi:hypothetical protein
MYAGLVQMIGNALHLHYANYEPRSNVSGRQRVGRHIALIASHILAQKLYSVH